MIGCSAPLGLQSFEFVVILNAWQFQPVDFRILQQKGFVRRPEHRIPQRPMQPVLRAVVNRLVHGGGSRREKRAAHTGQQGKSTNQSWRCSLNSQESVLLVGCRLLLQLSGHSKPCCQAVQPFDCTAPSITGVTEAVHHRSKLGYRWLLS